jgi:raffinose/stachyose/melibiose transport system substrate-binding protein
MKRIVTILSLILATTMLLGACKPAPTATPVKPTEAPLAEVKTLNVWWQEANVYGDKLKELAAQFEKENPGVKINITTYTFEDLMKTLPLAMGQPDGPDIAQVNQGLAVLGALVKAGRLLPMDNYIPKYGWDKTFSSGLLDRNRFTPDGKQFGEGTLWGISVSAEIVGVYYNRKIFTDNNYQVPKTFEDFEALLKTIKEKGITPLALGISGDAGPAIHYFSAIQHLLVTRQWLDDFVYGRNNVSFEIPENKQAADLELSWVDAGYFTPGYEGINADDMAKLFSQGQAAMLISGNWWANTFVQVDPNNWGFFVLPPFAGKENMAIGGVGLPLCINKGTKYPDLAVEFINYLVTEKSADAIASIGQLPSRSISSNATPDPLLKDIIAAFNEMNKKNAIGHYIDWAAPTMYDELKAALQELLGKQITSADFTKNIEQVYTDYLKTKQ